MVYAYWMCTCIHCVNKLHIYTIYSCTYNMCVYTYVSRSILTTFTMSVDSVHVYVCMCMDVELIFTIVCDLKVFAFNRLRIGPLSSDSASTWNLPPTLESLALPSDRSNTSAVLQATFTSSHSYIRRVKLQEVCMCTSVVCIVRLWDVLVSEE